MARLLLRSVTQASEWTPEALADVFSLVLAVCAKAGLVKVGVVAVDGTKVAASASKDQTLDFEQIAHEAIAEAKAMMRPGRAGGTVPRLH